MGLYADPSSWNELSIQTIILAGASLIAITFVLYCFCKFKELRTDSFKLVINILITDFVYTLTIFMLSVIFQFVKGNDSSDEYLANKYPTLCKFEAFISDYSILASCTWTSIVCHSMYCDVVGSRFQDVKTIYYLIGYIGPSIVAIIPVFLDAYGLFYPMPQTNCFIQITSQEYQLYSFLFFYFPIEVSFTFNVIVIIIVIVKIRQKLALSDYQTKSVFVLFIYPGIIFICWVLPAILSESGVQKPDFLFVIFYGLGAVIGLLDSICYAYFSIRNVLRIHFCRITLITQSQEELEAQIFLN